MNKIRVYDHRDHVFLAFYTILQKSCILVNVPIKPFKLVTFAIKLLRKLNTKYYVPTGISKTNA
jgi:hypothetical protein